MDRSSKELCDRLLAAERELAELQARYDVAMSAFKFDEANGIQRRILALEIERHALAGAFPAPAAPSEPPMGVTPPIGRARRRRVRRRG